MAWTYSDWITVSAVDARLTRLRLHIQEVSEKIDITAASDSTSRDSRTLDSYLGRLLKSEDDLSVDAGGRIRTSPMLVRGVVKGLR